MKKFISVIVAAAMLVSIAALPVSAKSVNNYTLTYTTMASPFTNANGLDVPTGIVAVTMRVENNQGFNSNTFTVALADDLNVVTNSDGSPVVDFGEVLNGFSGEAAVNTTENIVSVVVASAENTNNDGEVFTIYCTATGTNSGSASKLASIVPAYESVSQVSSRFSGNFYMIGDTDNNYVVNASDATSIYIAVDYNGGDILITDSYYQSHVSEFFPDYTPNDGIDNVPYYAAPNVTLDEDISDGDASEILRYAANVAAGNPYTGRIGTYAAVV